MSTTARPKKNKILLAQNDSKIMDDFVKIVSTSYDPICVSSENEILDALKDKDFLLVAAIIDIHIAEHTLEKIRDIPGLKNFPVLISTDIDNSELEEKLLALDAIDFLKIPLNSRRVLNRLHTAIKFSEVTNAINELEHDELTGLLTRKAFIRKAEILREQNPDKKLCVIAFDFDNFKASNSLYGVEKCNEFLAYTAKKMMEMMPKGIAGRYGGDQYIILVEYDKIVNVERINNISQEILNTAPVPHQVVKIGVYAPLDSEVPIVICCDRAFLALNEVKGVYGKNLAFFENRLQKQLMSEQGITETMERALEEEQFKVFYQPKHETITGNIAGAEALVRWNHPEYGFMAPTQFIPLFEKNGFISKLDTFMVEQVCRDIKRWQTDGYPVVPVSINVSRRDFLEPGCIEKQAKIIDSYGIDHSLIHMEVTESMYSENTEIIISQVKQMQDVGFLIEMDDFGAGYSTLGMLSSFPIDIIKLDISFVKNIQQNEIVIENMIKMAHRMELLTVAEGVETKEQYSILKALGCDFIQGFYFSKPLSTIEYEKYLKKTSVLPLGKINYSKNSIRETSPINESILMAASEVAEGIPGGFFTYHADGELELISFNHEMMKIFECSTADEFRNLVGNSFKGIVLAEDFERVQSSIERQILIDNDIDFVEYRIKTKKGKIRYIEDYGRFVRTKTYGDIFYVFLRDTTEDWKRKARDEADLVKKIALQKTAEIATSSNKAKNIFMYNISKDIMSTMRSIIDYTKKLTNAPLDHQIAETLIKKATQAEENLLGFINNISELSLIESNELTLNETPSDLTDAVIRIYELVENPAAEKNIKLEYWSEITHPYIYQDIVHTTDVVMNILWNAIKYTPEGGTVRFGLRQLPGKNDNECIVQFICEDNGIGISEEFLPYACTKFTREYNDVNNSILSSGLGMNIVYNLLELMNGTVEIKSEPGKGTTVKTSQPHRYANKKDLKKDTTLIDHLK